MLEQLPIYNDQTIEKFKSEGAAFFMETPIVRPNSSFGVAYADISRYLYALTPDQSFSRISKLFLPKPFRTWLKGDSIKFYEDYGNEGKYFLHHRFDRKRFVDTVKEVYESEKFLQERIGKTAGWNVDEFMEKHDEKFKDPTVIFSTFWTMTTMIGERGLMSELSQGFKTGNAKEILSALVDERTAEYLLPEGKGIHFYDLVNPPRETHLKI